jgi:hypothetical protein
MAYTDLFNVALDNLTTSLTAITGLRVVNNPQNINPPCVFIDAPNFEAFNYNIARIEFPVKVIGSGPANLPALREILAKCAALLTANVAVTRGVPSSLEIGAQVFPSYDLTIEMKTQAGL